MATNIKDLNVYIQDNGTVTPTYDVLPIDLNCDNGKPKKVGIALFDISNPLIPIRVYAESPNTKFFTIIFNCDNTYTVVNNDAKVVRSYLNNCNLNCKPTTKQDFKTYCLEVGDVIELTGYNEINIIASSGEFDINNTSYDLSSGISVISGNPTISDTVHITSSIGWQSGVISDTNVYTIECTVAGCIEVDIRMKDSSNSIQPIISYNFDLNMDWSILLDNAGNPYPVTDQATFEQWLTDGYDNAQEFNNNFTNIVITDFLMTGNRIQCNLTANCTNFSLSNNIIGNADKTGVLNGLLYLDLHSNQIVTFNPTIALPSSLVELYLFSNQIVTFNPTIALPSSLQQLDLSQNQMTTASYTTMESWANAQPAFTNTCDVYFTGNIDSVSGTNLKTILISKNCNVFA